MRYGARVAALARRAERDRAAFEADGGDDADPESADPDRADAYLREGAGPAIWLYVEGRTGGRFVHFSEAELAALEGAMNTWLELYARCHGVELEADFTIREAAEALLDTRNIHDVATVLTHVPQR